MINLKHIKIYKLIASGLGTGYTPIAPGTAGSLLGVLVLYFLNFVLYKLEFQQSLILGLNLIVIIIVLLAGVFSIKKVHQIWQHDASQIVIDEIVGVWIAVFALPFQWQYYLYGFILFRFFDIAKPLFIKKIDKLKSNWSVMLDDVLAGVYANIVIQLFVYINLMFYNYE